MHKKPWLQFHLSTAMVLMFFAGALIHANVAERDGHVGILEEPSGLGKFSRAWHFYWVESRGTGWPAFYYYKLDGVYELSIFALVFNFISALLVLSSIVWICEWKIRPKVELRQSGEAPQSGEKEAW